MGTEARPARLVVRAWPRRSPRELFAARSGGSANDASLEIRRDRGRTLPDKFGRPGIRGRVLSFGGWIALEVAAGRSQATARGPRALIRAESAGAAVCAPVTRQVSLAGERSPRNRRGPPYSRGGGIPFERTFARVLRAGAPAPGDCAWGLDGRLPSDQSLVSDGEAY